MAFTPPPPVPQRGARAIFSGAVDAFLKWMAALPAQLNAFLARLETIAAGGAYAIPYTFNNAFYGVYEKRFVTNNPTQNLSTGFTLGIVDEANADWAALFSSLAAGSSASKCDVRIVKQGDPSKFLIFRVTQISVANVYCDFFGNVVNSSSANPFTNDDPVLLYFQRTGDKGDVGNADKKVQTAPAPVNGVVTVDYRNGNCLVWSPTAESSSFLYITNWPAAGTLGEFWIVGNNLGSATVKMNATVNWLRPDGTYANSDNINANHGVTLRPSGEDNILLWGRNGAPSHGKVAR